MRMLGVVRLMGRRMAAVHRTVRRRRDNGAMLQAMVYGAGDLRLEERALDPVGPGQILVETEVTALSTGTDLGVYLGNSTEIPGAPDYPRTVGYSNVGVVRSAGPRLGQRVFSLRPHQSVFV